MGWANAFRTAFGCCAVAIVACAQDLAPRAYVIVPVGANAITLSTSYFDGPVSTDPTLPITDFTARFALNMLSYSRALGVFGRSATVLATVPYVLGTFHGTVVGVESHAYRSGMADSRLRFSVNLRGGPAMSPSEFAQWRERFVIGASFTVFAPTGQYDPARLINVGLNRWAFKPELGISRRWGRWALDVYGGLWFFTANNRFFPGTRTRTQAPVIATEIHWSYIAKPRFWASLDGNFWADGQTTVNGSPKHDFARDSRVGVTLSVPISSRQSLKFSYSEGAYISIGGNYSNVTAAWQYSWLSKAR